MSEAEERSPDVAAEATDSAPADRAPADTAPADAQPSAEEPAPRVSRWQSVPPWAWAALIIVVAGLAGLWLGTRHRDAEPEVEPPPTLPTEVPEDAETLPADLYFPGLDGRLYAERRDFPDVEPALRALTLARALLAGPSADTSSTLRPPLPSGVRVEAVFLRGTTAIVDLRPPALETSTDEGPPTPAELSSRRLSMGAKQELVALYSLVDTLVLGVEGIESVQILWDGRQPQTFAGHVDTTRPLRPNRDLMAGG